MDASSPPPRRLLDQVRDTQNQALSALLFLYREVLFLPLDARIDAVRAKPSRKLPTVLTKDEVRSAKVGWVSSA